MFSISTGEKSQANLFEAYIAALYGSLLKESQAAQNRISTPPLTPLHDSNPAPSSTLVGATANGLPSMDDGLAFITISTWLRGVFYPIATWAFEQMKAQRKVKHRPSQVNGVADDDDDDESMDDKAMGRTAQLNEHFTKYEGKLPHYDYSANPANGMWTCICSATQRGGNILCVPLLLCGGCPLTVQDRISDEGKQESCGAGRCLEDLHPDGVGVEGAGPVCLKGICILFIC